MEKPESQEVKQPEAENLIPPELANRPLIIQIFTVVTSWVKKRRANKKKGGSWIGRGIVASIVALPMVSHLLPPVGKAVAEKIIDPTFGRVWRWGVNWNCGLSQKLSQANRHQSKANAAWKTKDVRLFHQNYNLAFEIYKNADRFCESDQVWYELTIAHCEGFGTPKNPDLGREYMQKIKKESNLFYRVLQLREKDPKFCRE
jgi:hypothetical protein